MQKETGKSFGQPRHETVEATIPRLFYGVDQLREGISGPASVQFSTTEELNANLGTPRIAMDQSSVNSLPSVVSFCLGQWPLSHQIALDSQTNHSWQSMREY
jgi:hypothetical protein